MRHSRLTRSLRLQVQEMKPSFASELPRHSTSLRDLLLTCSYDASHIWKLRQAIATGLHAMLYADGAGPSKVNCNKVSSYPILNADVY